MTLPTGFASDGERLRRWAMMPGWLALGMATAGSMLVSYVTTAVAIVPLALSVVVFGLPHGATDHLVFARMQRGVGLTESISRVVGLYAVLGSLYLVAWWYFPMAAFLFFVAMTLVHWGQGDVHALRVFGGGRHLAGLSQRILAGIVRGGIPMLVPFVAFPGEVRRVAGWVTSSFASGSVGWGYVFQWEIRAVIAAVLGAAVLVHLLTGLIRGPVASWGIDALETSLLGLFFATVTPLLAIGVYFCLWHSLRHIVRLTLHDDTSRVAWSSGDVSRVIWRFARDAAPLTGAALGLFVGLAIAVPYVPGSLGEWAGLYLVFISVLTLPHVCLVFWMDGVEGVWRSGDIADQLDRNSKSD